MKLTSRLEKNIGDSGYSLIFAFFFYFFTLIIKLIMMNATSYQLFLIHVQKKITNYLFFSHFPRSTIIILANIYSYFR